MVVTFHAWIDVFSITRNEKYCKGKKVRKN